MVESLMMVSTIAASLATAAFYGSLTVLLWKYVERELGDRRGKK